MANFRDGSRYTGGVFTLDIDNEEFLVLRNNLVLDERDDDSFITVEGRFERRPDLVSQKVYGRPDLGWAIMDVNNIRQPMFELTTGQELRIPALQRVLAAIDELNKGL